VVMLISTLVHIELIEGGELTLVPVGSERNKHREKIHQKIVRPKNKQMVGNASQGRTINRFHLNDLMESAENLQQPIIKDITPILENYVAWTRQH